MRHPSTKLHRARFAIAGAIVLTLGCISGPVPGPERPAIGSGVIPARHDVPSVDAVEAVLAAARATVGVSSPHLDGAAVPTDCSGYLHALYRHARLDLFSEARPDDNGVQAILRWVERYGRVYRARLAAPGDLVFFDNSYDRDGDGLLDDPLTHAGLVEQVLPDGTLLIVHATNHGIVREPMNLIRPHETTDGSGRTINAPLRRRSPRDGPQTPHLMSELFVGFGSVFPRAPVAQAVAPDP